MTYQTSLDKTALTTTMLITIIFIIIIVLGFATTFDSQPAIPVFTSLGLFLIYIVTFGFRPVKYIVTEKELIIQRPVSAIRYNRTDIHTVELLDPRKLNGSIRTFAVGGLFGYYGKFSNFQLGPTVWYATRLDKTILLKMTDNKKIILTPDEPEDFLRELTS